MDKRQGRRRVEVKPRGDRISHAWTAEEYVGLPKYQPRGNNISEIIGLFELCCGRKFEEGWKEHVKIDIDGISSELNFRRSREGSVLLKDVVGSLKSLELSCNNLLKEISSLDDITLSYLVGSQSPRRPSTIPYLPAFTQKHEIAFSLSSLDAPETNRPQELSARQFMTIRGPGKKVQALGELAGFLQTALRELHGEDKGGNSSSRDLGAEWTGWPIERVWANGTGGGRKGDDLTKFALVRGYKDFLAYEVGLMLLTCRPDYGGIIFINSSEPSIKSNSTSGIYRKLMELIFEHATGLSAEEYSDGNFERQAKRFSRYFKNRVKMERS